MQTPDAAGHPRVNTYLKHFDAYATETNRMHSDNNLTAFDFWDTYLPQYEMVFTQAKAAGAMCSYEAENGMPSCANSWLLNDVMRGMWKREDAYITTDCGAVQNTIGPPLNLKTKEEAAAATINGGTDVSSRCNPPLLWGSIKLRHVFTNACSGSVLIDCLCDDSWRWARRSGTHRWPQRSRRAWSTRRRSPPQRVAG